MRRLGIWGVVAACAVVSILPLVPPSADSGDFEATAAMEHVIEIGQAPHPIGSTENERVRTYLIDTLTGLGLSPQTQRVTVMDYFGTPGNVVDVVNVLARVEGSGRGDAIALVAHYDTVPDTPGANDNSTSVAIMLEVAEDLVTRGPFVNDVILLFTDGEEPNPRFGSRAFVDDHPWFDDVAFVVNLEASGGSGASVLGEASGSTRWLIGLFTDAAPSPLAYSFFTEIAALIGGFGTDFDPFREADVPGLAFAYLHGSPIYHTDQDSIENVSLRSVQHQGANTSTLIRSLADLDLRPPRDHGRAVFFTVGRWSVLRYSATWAVPIVLAALLVFGASLDRRYPFRSLLRDLSLTLAAFMTTAVVGTIAWMAITSVRTTPTIWESYLYLGGLGALTAGIWQVMARRSEPPSLLVGVVGLWLVFALATSVFAPGVSYLFTWPALAAALVMAVRPSRPFWPVSAATLVALVVTVPVLDFLFQMAQPRPGNPDSELIPVGGLVTAIALLLIGLLQSLWRASSDESWTTWSGPKSLFKRPTVVPSHPE